MQSMICYNPLECCYKQSLNSVKHLISWGEAGTDYIMRQQVQYLNGFCTVVLLEKPLSNAWLLCLWQKCIMPAAQVITMQV